MFKDNSDLNKSPKALQKEKIQSLNKRISKYSAKCEDGIVDIKIFTGPISRRRALDLLNRLQNETMYIPASQPLIIKLDFEDQEDTEVQTIFLKETINNEIIKIIHHENQELRRIKILSSILFIVGVGVMLIATLLTSKQFFTSAVQQLFVIASWVFIWEAIDKMVFVRQQLVSTRLKLYQLYFAEYEAQKNQS